MASLACGLLFALCIIGSVLGGPVASKNTKGTGKSVLGTDDEFGLSKTHYKFVTVPDGSFIVKNGTGFSGPYITWVEAFSQIGNFTYDITVQADGNFGKKQANGKFNGMIGDVVSGKYDVILGNIAFTKDIAQVLSGAVLALNFTEWTMVNPKLKTGKKDYITRKDINYFLLKNSEDPATKAIWANIKGRMPGSIVADLDEAIKQVKAGKLFVADNDTVSDTVDANPDLAKDPVFVTPGIPVYPFATKKSSEIGLFLNTLLAMVSDDDSATDNWADELMQAIVSGASLPVDSSKRRR